MPVIVRNAPLSFDETIEVAALMHTTPEAIRELQDELLIGDEEEVGKSFPGGFLTLRPGTPKK